MIKKLLFSMLSIYTLVGFSQTSPVNPDILDSWYLHKYVEEGEEYIPNNFDADVRMSSYQIPSGDYYSTVYLAYVDVFYEILFDETLQQFSWENPFYDLDGQTCFGTSGTNCAEFFEIFGPFYEDYVGTIMTYEITSNGNNTKTLIITNIDKHQAIYNTEPLLAQPEFESKALNIFPNPAIDTFSINTTIALDEVNIYGIAGNLLFSEENPTRSFDISTLTAGVYFVEVISGNQRSVQKLVKE